MALLVLLVVVVLLCEGGRAQRGLRVAVGTHVPREQCRELLDKLKERVTLGVFSLSHSLGGRAGAAVPWVEVEVPGDWTAQHCGQAVEEVHRQQDYDILVMGKEAEAPWLVQPRGCGSAGSHIVLPLPALLDNKTTPHTRLGELLLRLRYGVFTSLTAPSLVTGRQAALCQGRSARQVVLSHPDFRGPGAVVTTNFSTPQFLVTRQAAPRYVLLLENSARMNSQGQWDFLRTAARDLVMSSLPAEAHLGIVLFNEAAHVAHPLAVVGEQGKSRTRQSLALQIKSKHALSPSAGSCVQCAVSRAVESLGGGGGVLILLSRAANISTDLLPLLLKHRLQLFSVALPEGGEAALPSWQLERLARASGGAAMLVPVPGGSSRPPLSLYTGLTDAFRQVLAMTLARQPAVIYNQAYPGFLEGRSDKEGTFVVDPLAGKDTSFRVFFPDLTESYVRGLSVSSRETGSFNTIMDSQASSQYLSVYRVPFDLAPNLGVEWHYLLERLAAPGAGNSHLVQVISRPREGQPELLLDVWTNLGPDGELVGPGPLILYVGVWLGARPVRGARVMCEVVGRDPGGLPLPPTTLHLRDGGAGDPDMMEGDGVYSKYFSQLQSAGRYSLQVTVSSDQDSPAHILGDRAAGGEPQHQHLGTFTRLLQGGSFHVTAFPADWNVARLPPCRILDLSVSVVTASQQLEFRWSAPGADYDEGRPTSYQLYQTRDAEQFQVASLPSSGLLVESFTAVRDAGGREVHRLTVGQGQVNQNLYYVLLAADREGNLGQLSNVVAAYMPRPLLVGHSPRDNSPLREGLFDPLRTANQPNIVVMYVIVGVVAVVIFSLVVIVLVIVLLRKKAPGCPSELSYDSQHPGGEQVGRKERSVDRGDLGLGSTLLVSQLHLYSSLGRGGAGSGQGSSTEDGCSPDIFAQLPSTRECYVRGYQPSPSRLSPGDLCSVLEHHTATHRREEGDGAEGHGLQEPLYAESSKRRQQFCPSSLIEAEYCRVAGLRKVPPPTLPKPLTAPDVTISPRSVTDLDLLPPYGSPLLLEERERNYTTV